MPDTAGCRSISSRLSAEEEGRKTLFFPSPKQQTSCRPSCPYLASLHGIHHSQGEGSGASMVSPPVGLVPGLPRTGALQTGEPQHPANSHTEELLPRGQPCKGQKLCSSALLVLPSCKMGLRTLYHPCALNYLDGSQKAQTGLCPCLQHASCGAVPAPAGAQQRQCRAACCSSLLPALGRKAELCLPAAQGGWPPAA